MHWIVLMGFITGLRTMTGIAVVCWCAHFGLLPVDHTWAFWTASWASVIVFSLAAVGEYVGDVLPHTPSRRSPGPALARLAFAALVGAVICVPQMEPVAGGAILAMIGAVIGMNLGYWARMKAAGALGRDLPVGLAESALALGLAIADGYWLHMAAWRSVMIEAGRFHSAG